MPRDRRMGGEVTPPTSLRQSPALRAGRPGEKYAKATSSLRTSPAGRISKQEAG